MGNCFQPVDKNKEEAIEKKNTASRNEEVLTLLL
jgi:hypothetical protein